MLGIRLRLSLFYIDSKQIVRRYNSTHIQENDKGEILELGRKDLRGIILDVMFWYKDIFIVY